MKLHEREVIVEKASLELCSFLLDLRVKHKLTCAEVFFMLGERIATVAKYALRTERYGADSDKRGDEA